MNKEWHYFANKCPSSQSSGFSVVMYRYKNWTIKKAEHWKIDAYIVVLEKTLVSPLDCKETQPVNPKENSSWIVSRRNDAEAEVPILWPPDEKSWLIKKDLDAGKYLKAGGEGDNRRLECWMASLTQQTGVWASLWSWWWTGKPGMFQALGSKESDTTEWLHWLHWRRKTVSLVSYA